MNPAHQKNLLHFHRYPDPVPMINVSLILKLGHQVQVAIELVNFRLKKRCVGHSPADCRFGQKKKISRVVKHDRPNPICFPGLPDFNSLQQCIDGQWIPELRPWRKRPPNKITDVIGSISQQEIACLRKCLLQIRRYSSTVQALQIPLVSRHGDRNKNTCNGTNSLRPTCAPRFIRFGEFEHAVPIARYPMVAIADTRSDHPQQKKNAYPAPPNE